MHRSVFPGKKKSTPNQISIDLQCKCIQAPQGTSGCSQTPNEGFLRARLLPLLLPEGHRRPHNRPPLHQAQGDQGAISEPKRSPPRWAKPVAPLALKVEQCPLLPFCRALGQHRYPPSECCRAGGAQHRLCPSAGGDRETPPPQTPSHQDVHS